MTVGDTVLVKSFPQDPLVRQIYLEGRWKVLVWQGGASDGDLPAPCPKSRVFVYEPELYKRMRDEIKRQASEDLGRVYSATPVLAKLWEEAKPYYGDVDKGLELRPEVKDRLLRSLRAPRSSFISADEMRKQE